jgi:hypothetical protein
VALIVGFWIAFGPRETLHDTIDACVAISLSGIYVAARRLLFDESPLPLGIALWGSHGVFSVLAIAIFMFGSGDAAGTATASAGRVLLYCLAALVVQVLIGVVALVRLVHGRTCGPADLAASAVCVGFGVAMGGWLISILS